MILRRSGDLASHVFFGADPDPDPDPDLVAGVGIHTSEQRGVEVAHRRIRTKLGSRGVLARAKDRAGSQEWSRRERGAAEAFRNTVDDVDIPDQIDPRPRPRRLWNRSATGRRGGGAAADRTDTSALGTWTPQ